MPDNSVIKFRFYVDFFNLYHCVMRPYGIRWVDLEKLLLALVRQKFPNAEVEKIFLFTSPLKGDKEREKQTAYLNALQAHSRSVKVVFGEHNEVEKTVRVGAGKEKKEVKGKLLEEKQTDVNLACQIVEDAYTDAAGENPAFHVGCLVSGDKDFLYPLKAKKRKKQRMALIVPATHRTKNMIAHGIHVNILGGDKILSIPRKLMEECASPTKSATSQSPPNGDSPSPLLGGLRPPRPPNSFPPSRPGDS